MKTKREMRKDAIEQLQKFIAGECRYSSVVHAIEGNAFYKHSSKQDAEYLIDLLTDDEPQYEGDAYAMGPRDADGILWFRGDMSDSEWGVIERTHFDGERWMVCGHDLTAPWVPADSIRHAPMRTATQREDDLIELIKDAAMDYEGLQADCRVMSDLKDMCWQKFKDLHEAVDERYIELPKDANGEVIHIGDEVVVNARGRRLTVDGVGRSGYDVIFCADRPGYTAYVAKTCHRYHKPTVDEILDELEGMRGTGDYDAVVKRCADLAGMLRELLKEGKDEDQA